MLGQSLAVTCLPLHQQAWGSGMSPTGEQAAATFLQQPGSCLATQEHPGSGILYQGSPHFTALLKALNRVSPGTDRATLTHTAGA